MGNFGDKIQFKYDYGVRGQLQSLAALSPSTRPDIPRVEKG